MKLVNKQIQVVILAGGKGTRLLPITQDRPKPLVLIHGKPFLEYQFGLLRYFQFTDILLLTGYLGGKIEEYFKDGSKWGLKITYAREQELLGTAGALKNAASKIKEDFLLLNGDTFTPMDYQDMYKVFLKNRKIGVIAVSQKKKDPSKNNIAVGESNLIVDCGIKDSVQMNGKDVGVKAFKKEILDLIPSGKTYSLENDVYPQLIKNKELAAYITNNEFYDMGSFEGLKNIEKVLKNF